MEEKRVASKSLETTQLAGVIMKQGYARAKEAVAAGNPVAWVMASTNGAGSVLWKAIDLLMGIPTIFPENYAALCAAKGTAIPFIEQALPEGFSNFLCGYAKTCIGYSRVMQESGEVPPGAPGGGMAKPAMFFASSEICDARYKWFQALTRYFDVPVFCLDSLGPYTADLEVEEFSKYYIKYRVREMREFVAGVEKLTGRKMDEDKLSELVDRALETARLWHECHQMRRAIPCPMPWEDMWSCITPGMYHIGTPEALDFYRKLYAELKERVDKGIGAIPDEKYRLIWGALAPWHTLSICNYLESLGAVGVVETWEYTPGPPPPIPEGVTDPYERIAWWYLWWYTHHYPRARGKSEHFRNQIYLEWARDYLADGAVLHWIITCRTVSVGEVQAKDVLLKYARIPSLIVEGDLIDPRFFNEAQFKVQADAFIEAMEHYKRIRQEEGLPVAHPV
jgi:benzoyl-CoA reductase/2-hydroxyglutaryl-CoA dehydratase subunit BcrC/BadD/HgdB